MEKKFRSGCPIASILDILGDKWFLLIIRDLLIKHKRTFGEVSNSDEKIAPSILSARFKTLEAYGLVTKHKLPTNKKENIYLLSEKGVDLAPLIVEYTLWGDKYMREYNDINSIPGLNSDKSLVIDAIQSNYREMVREILE